MAWLSGWWNILMDWWTESRRAKADEPRLWLRDSGDSLREVTCGSKVAVVLVVTGLAESGAEAIRLLRAGAVEWRPWDLSSWWKKVEVKDILPTGVPMLLRKGKRFYGVQLVMVPEPTQSLRFWQQMLTED